MNFKNMRVILVAAIVAALLGGGVATAKTLIKGKDIASNAITGAKIKSSSITSSDVKNGSLSIGDLTKATQKLIRAKGTGDKGATGATGATGPAGSQGPAGPAGPAGAGFDPSKVGAATSQIAGFTPWYDSSTTTKVSFTDAGLVIDNGKNGIGGVNLPIPRGTSLSSLGSIKYTSVATDGSAARGAVLAIEVYTQGGIYQSTNDYTTLYLAPAASGETDAFADANQWVSTRPAASGTLASATWKQQLAAIGDRAAQNKAIVLNASVRTFGSASDTDKSATAALTSVSLGYLNAEKPVTYSFVK
ncbi:hypothetical protein AB0L40_25280 [Patulibacter sp. NPDC049589]|uniref:hypothetical protein n=1 Tax=Patulibacter sp. NPDC049589 TaxID=3154731 RepID=UPI00342693AF